MILLFFLVLVCHSAFASLPYISNYNLQGGYFTMPSARMREAGYIEAMYANVEPYQIFSLSFQPFNRLELSGNYWVFKGVQDTFLGKDFGDSADRAGDFRFSVIHEKDCFIYLPEIAIGAVDFFGSKRFYSYYLVATKQFKKYCFEATLGYGNGRIDGFFGGIAFSPFGKLDSRLTNLSLIAEYDANNYQNHKDEHPKGRNVNYPINFGLTYTFKDFLSLKVSSIRGEDVAFALNIKYPIGRAEPLLGKRGDPLFYSTPIDHEPLGLLRKDKQFAQELAFSFLSQGLDLYSVKVCGSRLWLKVVNQTYRKECEVRRRIEKLLAALVPSNYQRVTVVIESDGLAVQQYTYQKKDLLQFDLEEMSECDLWSNSRRSEVIPFYGESLYERKKNIWNFLARPRLRTLFGSTQGKIKYDLSLIADLQGYLFDQFFYEALASYTISSSVQDLGACDKMNPSQIINVRTDKLLYMQSSSFHVEKLYAQKGFNLSKGLFARAALGYFESAYAGIALEALYYPVSSNFAVGLEGALMKKRNYYGMGFTNKIRKYKGYCPEEVPFPYASQYFLDLYYYYPKFLVDSRVSVGQFLARDKGVQIELGKNFYNGVRVYFWYTFTNGDDHVNGEIYFDKGVGLSVPLELISYKSSKRNLGYGMSAWLRDVGAKAETGNKLYPTIFSERNPF